MSDNNIRKAIKTRKSDGSHSPATEDTRDIFEKIFDQSGTAIPYALMGAGALAGSRLGKRAARREYEHSLHGIRPGEEIVDRVGNTRRATQRDSESFESEYRGKLRAGSIGGGLAGATLGATAGMPIVGAGIRKKEKARK